MVTAAVFKAPWGNTLIAITSLVGILLLAMVLFGLLTGPRSNPVWIISMVLLPLGILVTTAFLGVWGYRVDGQTLYVQRLGWQTAIALEHLQSVEQVPAAMKGSIKTWGNGGLFSFAGRFRNATLGPYEAYATDLTRTVVLTFPSRKIVLSPEEPERFVRTLSDPQNLI
ncbi:MAG: PH domain-containing protein [Cyanobacteria bacterium]|nr:PH domain-containing protein [Cyanobacteriota bacterium]MDA0867147.1 PH domain-containing protein [Cyanobacteriota bacterium]